MRRGVGWRYLSIINRDERTYKLCGWMWSLVGEGLSLGLVCLESSWGEM